MNPAKKLIIVPKQPAPSSWTAAFNAALVTYYAPGCFHVNRVLRKCYTLGEAQAYITANYTITE